MLDIDDRPPALSRGCIDLTRLRSLVELNRGSSPPMPSARQNPTINPPSSDVTDSSRRIQHLDNCVVKLSSECPKLDFWMWYALRTGSGVCAPDNVGLLQSAHRSDTEGVLAQMWQLKAPPVCRFNRSVCDLLMK
jgi:hypothetical protein